MSAPFKRNGTRLKQIERKQKKPNSILYNVISLFVLILWDKTRKLTKKPVNILTISPNYILNLGKKKKNSCYRPILIDNLNILKMSKKAKDKTLLIWLKSGQKTKMPLLMRLTFPQKEIKKTNIRKKKKDI